MRALPLLGIGLLGGCVYFNAMYDANRAYDEGERSAREQSPMVARVQFDSVIAKTGRIVKDHPTSKYADDAAILKARAELNNELYESAIQTSLVAEKLANGPRNRDLALGLRGVATRNLGRYPEADSLLTRSLNGDVGPEDRAVFLFQRGLARQQLGQPELAAADLEAAASSVSLSPEGSLTLAIALRNIGEYEQSADLSARLLSTASPNPQSPLYMHVDSLALLAPLVVDSMAARLLLDSTVPATRQAGYRLIEGRALAAQGRDSAALASFEAALATASTSQAAADAAWYAADLLLGEANRPEEVSGLLRTLQIARRSSRAELRQRAEGWNVAATEFLGLQEAYGSRGASAAEALLRGAEVAHFGLEALALARGEYLLYLQVAPDSRWAAKAIYGALGVSGHRPDSTWVVDHGAATDAELRRRLDALPQDDPYRLAMSGDSVGFMGDSMYVLAEADLERRLTEIHVLFDPTTARDTTAEQAKDEVQPAPDDEIQN